MEPRSYAFSVSGTVGALMSAGVTMIPGHEPYFVRVKNCRLDVDDFLRLSQYVKALGVTDTFKQIIDYFKTPAGETPAGFRVEYKVAADGELLVDLKRDIGYGKNSVKRGTGVLYSADCASPYEIYDCRNVIANVTTNPAIIYNTFINNPKANVGGKFKTREEVMVEIANIVGPGVDISVELNNPFASEQEILEEAAQFKELLSPYRLVVKVPHLGPITQENLPALLGDGFPYRYNEATAASAFHSHNLALMLHEHGYRTNFTLMAEPHQTAIALQAKPSFINTFVRNRYHHNEQFEKLLKCFEATGDENFLIQLRAYMIQTYYLAGKDSNLNLFEVKRTAEWLLKYRRWEGKGRDGLDQARHNLRVLRQSNLPETKLIICSMDGHQLASVEEMLMEEEFDGMSDRVVVTVSPDYLARFTSSPAVLQYNKSFITAAAAK